ncbi:hypothetical protein ACFXDO_25210 [Streptomyces nigra]|uniref:hypothetical protein n=1 Tax=Streptomyces nigra TaxID=1827580 RepID=UPI0036D0206F
MSEKPSPIWEPWLLVLAVRPSMEPESYASVSGGTGPAGAGGRVTGYDHEKEPDDSPACQAEEGDSGVAARSPAPAGEVVPDSAARAITVGVALAATAVRAVTVCALASLSDATGVVVRQAAFSGVVSTHAGSFTRPSRVAQLPPTAEPKEL